MRITIADVAREADVSIATVSRFLNGREGEMSDGTRDRIQAVIDRLGYVPDSAARSLKTRHSRLIGVALAEIAHVYWSAVLAGVEERCLERGYGVVISSAGNDLFAQRDAVSLFIQQRVEGLLLNPTSADPETASHWASLGCPVIMLDRSIPGLAYPLVAVDGRLGTRIAIDHLVSLGHRDIGFVGWEIAGLSNRAERLDGYKDALRHHGIAVREDHIRLARESWDDGVRRTVSLLAGPDRPTAVFSATMELNLQVLAALKQIGLRVPEQVSVVGFDAAPWDDLLDPPLTTVSAPAQEIGRRAARRLIDAIERGQPMTGDADRIRPSLTIRRSTAPPRADADNENVFG